MGKKKKDKGAAKGKKKSKDKGAAQKTKKKKGTKEYTDAGLGVWDD
jgi:hypothetical protein